MHWPVVKADGDAAGRVARAGSADPEADAGDKAVVEDLAKVVAPCKRFMFLPTANLPPQSLM